MSSVRGAKNILFDKILLTFAVFEDTFVFCSKHKFEKNTSNFGENISHFYHTGN